MNLEDNIFVQYVDRSTCKHDHPRPVERLFFQFVLHCPIGIVVAENNSFAYFTLAKPNDFLQFVAVYRRNKRGFFISRLHLENQAIVRLFPVNRHFSDNLHRTEKALRAYRDIPKIGRRRCKRRDFLFIRALQLSIVIHARPNGCLFFNRRIVERKKLGDHAIVVVHHALILSDTETNGNIRLFQGIIRGLRNPFYVHERFRPTRRPRVNQQMHRATLHVIHTAAQSVYVFFRGDPLPFSAFFDPIANILLFGEILFMPAIALRFGNFLRRPRLVVGIRQPFLGEIFLHQLQSIQAIHAVFPAARHPFGAERRQISLVEFPRRNAMRGVPIGIAMEIGNAVRFRYRRIIAVAIFHHAVGITEQ